MTRTVKNGLLLLFCLIVGAAIGAAGRFDFLWDFLNYHFHNPWAFLNERADDVAPASVNTFFDPLPDLPLWFLIRRFNGFPALVYGIQGLWFGVLLFVFIKFARLAFSGNTAADYAKTVLAAALAATGQATFFQIGASTNEIQMAVFVTTAFYFSAKWILNPDLQDWKKFAFLGVFFGFGLGMKPTVLPYCAASGSVLIMFRGRLKHPAVFVAAYCFGGLAGGLLSNGWFMLRYWDLYQNPFFPFLNGVFKSGWFDAFNYADGRYRPTAENFWYYPLSWFKRPYRIAETLYYDYRFPVFYILLLLSAFKVKSLKTAPDCWRVYWAFALTSLTAWYFMFCILRYAVVLEMLAAIPVAAATINAVVRLQNGNVAVRAAVCCFWIVLCGVFLTTPIHSFPWDKNRAAKYVDIEIPAELPEKFLLKLYGFPTAGVAPVWAASGRDFKIAAYRQLNAVYMAGSDFADRGLFRKKRDAIERENTLPVVIVYRLPAGKNAAKVLDGVDLSGFSCRELENNLDPLLNVCLPEK